MAEAVSKDKIKDATTLRRELRARLDRKAETFKQIRPAPCIVRLRRGYVKAG